ncbi:MAG: DUF222 domain-containing protein, partial [Mycobacteriales bacterium]
DRDMSSLAAVVRTVCGADLSAADVPTLQQTVTELRQAIGCLSGKLDEALAELEVRGDGQVPANPGSDGPPLSQATRTWWRDEARVSGGQAGRDLRRAAALRRLPVLGAAVTDGRLTPAQAAVLCRLDGRIPTAELEASQEQLVLVAASMHPEDLGQWVRHLLATHCEPSFDADQEAAHRRRYLQLVRNPDGTVTGRFVLDNEDAEPLFAVIEPLARRQGLADQRCAGERRADALVDVFNGALQWMELPRAGGQRPQLSYVMPAGWACGDAAPSLQELLDTGVLALPTGAPTGAPTAAERAAGQHPQALEEHCATAAWTGPQTRTRIETVLCDARISRVLRDSIGQVVGLQALRDQITPAQRRALVARDRHCVARGCTRPPAFCDAHHLLAREDGGATSLDNLVLLCRRHHVLWHRGRLRRGDLHVPWLHSPFAAHAPPLVA